MGWRRLVVAATLAACGCRGGAPPAADAPASVVVTRSVADTVPVVDAPPVVDGPLAADLPPAADPPRRKARVLTLHVLANAGDVTPQQLEQLRRQVFAASRPLRWLEAPPEAVEHLSETELHLHEHGGTTYVLAWDAPGRAMSRSPGAPPWVPWRIKRAYVTLVEGGEHVVGIELNDAGARLLSDLSAANVGRPLAVALDGVVITAPVIRTRLGSHVIIQGGPGGFTLREAQELARYIDRSPSSSPAGKDR